MRMDDDLRRPDGMAAVPCPVAGSISHLLTKTLNFNWTLTVAQTNAEDAHAEKVRRQGAAPQGQRKGGGRSASVS